VKVGTYGRGAAADIVDGALLLGEKLKE